MIINAFNKGFNAVYRAKVRCPNCKEEIYANALICPYCKSDLKTPYFVNRTRWQKWVMIIILIFACIIGISICVSDTPVVVGILVGLLIYGLGYIIVQKIQSFINFNSK